MQNTPSVPRGALFILSGAAAVAITYLTLKQLFQHSPKTAEPGLHRSNAVRRRRRRWREGVRPLDLDHDPTAAALQQLRQNEESGLPYGYYHNSYYVTQEMKDSHDESFFELMPSTIGRIHAAISETHALSENLSKQLLLHIQACFLQHFLNAEYPEGYLVSPDYQEILAALPPTFDEGVVRRLLEIWDRGDGLVDEHLLLGDSPEENNQLQNPEQLAAALTGVGSRRASDDADEGDNTVLHMLYRIGEEQAKRNGYQHRGVECNSCGMQPIQGIRYHCANCWDYDLCETCESQQFHTKTHVFYKIRIPAPTRGQIKLVQPKWYPGHPNGCAEAIPAKLKESLLETTELDRQDLDALYEQFKCIASEKVSDDPEGVGMAICRRDFDRYFTTTAADRPPVPNALYGRIYAFYDQDSNGLITFREFAFGMAELANNTTREARIQRLFKAFDANGDGFVERRDFLYLLRAHYELNKELAHEMIYARDDTVMSDEEMLAVIHANNPISAAFGGNAFASHASRNGQGKHVDSYGDLVLDHGSVDILREDSKALGDRAEAIARQASEVRSALHARASNGQQDEPVIGGFGLASALPFQHASRSLRHLQSGVPDQQGLEDDSWHNDQLEEADVVQALGSAIPIERITEPSDRQRVLQAQQERLWTALEDSTHELEEAAVHDRWKRRQFYLDEEEGFSKPVGYHESDSSDEDDTFPDANGAVKEIRAVSRPRSIRSRSSSKVRFDIEDEVETKSDISSRNTPVNERWGGFDFTRPDRDVGVEIIYEAVQEAFNNILDHFFREKEDKAMEAKATKKIRKQYAALLKKYNEKLVEEDQKRRQKLVDADMERTKALLNADIQTNGEEHNSSAMVSTPNGCSAQNDEVSEGIIDPTLPQNRPDEVEDSVLADWHQHELTEIEAADRGGFGRLNINEFKRKLRDDNNDDIDIGGEGQDDDEHYWEEKADLGRFSFLSSWIEMASF